MNRKHFEITGILSFKNFHSMTYILLFSFSSFNLTAIPKVVRAANYRTVALEGQQAPGTPTGNSFLLFDRISYTDAPTINNAGQVAFVAAIGGDGVNEFNAEGIWSEGSGSLALIAREGNQAPGTNKNFLAVASPIINENGNVAFQADITGGVNAPSHFDGIWVGMPGSVSLVAGDGQATPPPPSEAFYYALRKNFQFNNNDIAALTSSIVCSNPPFAPSDCGESAYSGETGNMSIVAGTDMNPPGLPAGITFSTAASTGLNDNGEAVIFATLQGVGVDGTNDRGIWSEGSGSLQLVAREGAPAPGTPAGVNFNNFRQAVINDAGNVAFQGRLVGPGINGENGSGIWSDRSGSLSLVVQAGMQAPDPDIEIYFSEFDSPVMNNANQIAFNAKVSGPGINFSQASSLWLDDGAGNLNLLVREGDNVPGLPADVVFSRPSQPVLNASGQVVFVASTYVPGGCCGGPRTNTLWIADPTDGLEKIMAVGDEIQVFPGDFRTVGDFQFYTGTNQLEGTGQGDGRPSAFNDAGQIAVFIEFTDSSEGIFVVSTTVVPEPSTLLLTLLGLSTASIFRYRFFEPNRD